MNKPPRRVKLLYKKGKLSMVYSDGLSQKIASALQSEIHIKRVSHVEAIPNKKKILFQADLSPINGPILTGFPSYESAVNAEIAWIQKNRHTLTPKPKTHVRRNHIRKDQNTRQNAVRKSHRTAQPH